MHYNNQNQINNDVQPLNIKPTQIDFCSCINTSVDWGGGGGGGGPSSGVGWGGGGGGEEKKKARKTPNEHRINKNAMSW